MYMRSQEIERKIPVFQGGGPVLWELSSAVQNCVLAVPTTRFGLMAFSQAVDLGARKIEVLLGVLGQGQCA